MKICKDINIKDYNYPLTDDRIAKYPLEERDKSKLLVYGDGEIVDSKFASLTEHLPSGGMVVFNNTKVVRARLVFHKSTGARIEIFCLEPHNPKDYERAFACCGKSQWQCMIGNSKKWKEGDLVGSFSHEGISYTIAARRVEGESNIVEFECSSNALTFGQVLELLGQIPIPPYLNRKSEELDNERYQTVYSHYEGSVAAPTAGLHFTDEIINQLKARGTDIGLVTLHVGAGTFLPVKEENALNHEMHTEHFTITESTLERLVAHYGNITAVGTTSVRTLESVAVLGARVLASGAPNEETVVGQWEAYPIVTSGRESLEALLNYMQSNKIVQLNGATQIMITPEYKLKVVDRLVTNFHQPQSTLLLLISAFVGEQWQSIYKHALEHDYRFLSYGDSSLLQRTQK